MRTFTLAIVLSVAICGPAAAQYLGNHTANQYLPPAPQPPATFSNPYGTTYSSPRLFDSQGGYHGNLNANPIADRPCPTPRQFAWIWLQCPRDNDDAARRCALPWSLGEIWRCAKSDPALNSLTLDDYRALAGQPPLSAPQPRPAPPADGGTFCDRLLAQMARRTDLPDDVRGAAILKLLEACHGVAPPRPQTTDCMWIGGIWSCTTR
jgi:hypothetical protein